MPFLLSRVRCGICKHELDYYGHPFAVCTECDEEWRRREEENFIAHPMGGKDSPMWIVAERWIEK